MRRLLAIALALLAAPVTAQRTWVVAPSGGNFTQIQPAIKAASNGDRIEVRAGWSNGFTLTKRLAIVGSKARVDRSSVSSGAEGAEIAGLEFFGLDVNRVRGPLLLRESGTFWAFSGPLISIRDSGPVHISRSNTIAQRMTITGSRVYLHGSVVTGGGRDIPTGKGNPAIIATDSQLVVADSKITGSDGQSGPSSCGGFPPKGPGGAGVILVRTTLHVIAGSEIKGGMGGRASSGKCKPDGPGVSGGTALVSTDSKVIGGATKSLGAVPKLELVASLNRGQTGIATLTLPSGTSVVSFFSETPGHFRLPGFGVPVLLGGTIHWFDTRSVSSGRATIPVRIPNLPLFKDLNLFFQSVGVRTGGAAEVSNATVLSIR